MTPTEGNESIIEPSSDNDDLGETEHRRRQQNERHGQNGNANRDGRISKYEQYHVSLCSLIISLILPIICLITAPKITSLPTFLYLAEHRQLVDDWTTRPFVDIVLVDADQECPIDYEPLFYRNWNGTYAVCVEDK